MQIAILYFGLYYLAGKNDNLYDMAGLMWFVFVMILFVSIFFLAIFITFMRLEMLKSTVTNQSLLFKILSCGRISDKKAFMDQHGINALGHDEVRLS